MDFAFSETQKQFGESAERLLSKSASSERMRASLKREPDGYDRQLWRELADLGALAITIPEQHGGLGMGDLDLCVVAEALGRALARVPFASTVYWATEVLLRLGARDQQARWLPLIASGNATATFVDLELCHDAHLTSFGERLTGVLPVVADGMASDLIIIAGAGAVWLLLPDVPGLSREPLQTIDLVQPSARFELVDARAERLGGGDVGVDLPRIRDRVAVLMAFEQIGGCDAALRQAVGYAKERKAFGRAIGSFQAVKHMLANMYVASTLSRSNAYYAGWALETGDPSLPLAAASARISASGAFRQCAADAIQVHGGIGFTWELDCHFRYRRANHLALALGPMRLWEDRLLAALVVEHREEGSGI